MGSSRKVVGNISVSLDGRITGPGGEHDMGWVAKHAVSEAATDLLHNLMRSSTTVLLGRKNYEGFGGYWPTVADDEQADPRMREFSRWLDQAEKIVFSRTLTEATWQNSTVTTEDPAAVVARLREEDGSDVWVMSSASLIVQLLEAKALDRLSLTLCPEISGGGARLLGDGLPSSSWSLASATPTDTGALVLAYDLQR